MDEKLLRHLIKAQRFEITEHCIYKKLAKGITDTHNKKVLLQIAKDELKHATILKSITNVKVSPNMLATYYFVFLSKMLGMSFTLRLMEQDEKGLPEYYEAISKDYPKLRTLIEESETHEQKLIDLLSEKRIEYAGSVVLGLNDALVELTGALAGLTFALRNPKIIAISGLITGFAASLSMAASHYLQSREEADQNTEKNPGVAAVFTGIAYIITVLLLVTPYLLLTNVYLSLGITLTMALLIIFSYNYYISIAKKASFWKRFIEMAVISLSVAAISFGVGTLLRLVVGVDI